MVGVETELWPTAAKKAGKWYRGIVKAADGFTARWHRTEVQKSCLRHADEDVKKKGEKEKGGWGGGGAAAVLTPLSIKALKNWQNVPEQGTNITNIRNLCHVFPVPEFELDFEIVLLHLALMFGLFFWLFGFIFPWGGDSSSTELGGRRRREQEEGGRPCGLSAGCLGNGELENYVARASPLWYEYEWLVFAFFVWPHLFRQFVLSINICLSFPSFFALITVMHHNLPKPTRHVRERSPKREMVQLFRLYHCVFLLSLVYIPFQESFWLFVSMLFVLFYYFSYLQLLF